MSAQSDRLNPFHEAAIEVAQEILQQRRENAVKGERVTPFGMERLDAVRMRKRLREDEGLRRRILAQGLAGRRFILDLFRQGQS